MKISYYPGCTLKMQAGTLEESALSVAKHLGMELVEMENWNCCGTVSSLSSDNLMQHIAPLRVLTRALKNGNRKIVTLCTVCWNTLKQSNELIKKDPEKLEKINSFLIEEKDEQLQYDGRVEVLHFLEILRDEIGFENISKMLKDPSPLDGKRIAPYYGCLFTRPEGISIDSMTEQPRIMSDLFRCLGAIPVDFPFSVECCGSYHVVNQQDITQKRVKKIVSSAMENSADIIACSCPMCMYNLENLQEKTATQGVPILYFTQLMAEAFGITT